MSSDGTSSAASLTALSRDPAAGSARASSPNEAAIDAIRAHHAQLAEQLHVHTNAVVTAARTGECGRERDALHNWYRTELMPHVAAEEHALQPGPGRHARDPWSPARRRSSRRLRLRL